MELRVAAGEAVALLYSSIDLAHLAEEAEGLESLVRHHCLPVILVVSSFRH